jgi:hypothetical protein
MKNLPAIQSDRRRSPDGLKRAALSPAEASETIDKRDIGYNFSVRLWLAAHQVGPAREETSSAARSISSSMRVFLPVSGRWAFLTREEKSYVSWAGLSRALITDPSRSGH